MMSRNFIHSAWQVMGLCALGSAMLIPADSTVSRAEILGETGFESNCQRRIGQEQGRIKCGGLRYGLQATRNLDYSFNFVRSPVASGDWAARFELRSDDANRDSNAQLPIRSEILFDTGLKTGPDGDDIWYSYKVRLESFEPDNSWEIIGQGGAQNGYWNGGCDSGPPNFSFSPVQLEKSKLAWSFAIRHTAGKPKCRNSRNTLSRTWTFDEVPFELGTWVHIVVNLKSTYQSDGYARIWLNGSQVLDYQGPSGFYVNNVPLSSRRRTLAIKPAGIYKRGYNNQLNDGDRSKNIVVYLDDVVFARNSSYEEVTQSLHSKQRSLYWSQVVSLVEEIFNTFKTT